MKKIILFSIAIITITIFSAFQIYYTSGCPNHSGSPADGLTCSSCHAGGANTPSVIINSVPAFGPNNTYIPGTTYTISITGQGYNLFGFDLEILNSNSNIFNSVLDFGTINSISPFEMVNTPSSGNGYTYSDIMHTTPNASPFTLEWTAPTTGTGYLYCALLGINNNGNTSGDKCCTTSLTLTPYVPTNTFELSDNKNEYDISIYPNPCYQTLNVVYKTKKSKSVTISLYNTLGIKLFDMYHGEDTEGTQSLNYIIPSNLEKGAYIININIDNYSMTKKLILK